MQIDVCVKLLSLCRKCKDRRSANEPVGPNLSIFRVIATKSSKQSRSLNVYIQTPCFCQQGSESEKRGRRRQSIKSSSMTLSQGSAGKQGGVYEFSAFEQLVELVWHDDSWFFFQTFLKFKSQTIIISSKNPLP